MKMEDLLVELMNLIGEKKHESPADVARYWAILFTDIEKAYAFYMCFLYSGDFDAEMGVLEGGE